VPASSTTSPSQEGLPGYGKSQRFENRVREIDIDTRSDSERCFAEQVIAWTSPGLAGSGQIPGMATSQLELLSGEPGALAERLRHEAESRLA